MTALLREWVLGIVAVSLLSSFAQSLTEGMPSRRVVRVISALLLLLVILRPMARLQGSDLEDMLADYSGALARETVYTEAASDEILRQTTESALNAWAEARAAARGISCRAEVRTEARDGAAYPVACVLTLAEPLPPAEAEALAREIAAGLGIAAVTIR